MKVNRLSSWSVDPHGLVAIRGKEQMTVIGGHNAVLNAGCS
jgi:hypothetical protein